MTTEEKLKALELEFMLFKDTAQRAAIEKVLDDLKATKLFPDEVFEVLSPGRIFAMIIREMSAVS